MTGRYALCQWRRRCECEIETYIFRMPEVPLTFISMYASSAESPLRVLSTRSTQHPGCSLRYDLPAATHHPCHERQHCQRACRHIPTDDARDTAQTVAKITV